MRELIVVRHGESDGNVAGVVQGRSQHPLTDVGRRQAGAVADLIEAKGAWGPEVVIASPLARCEQTGAIIAARLGLSVTRDEAFTEIDCGSAAGRTWADLRREYAGFFDRPASEWTGFHEFGGESDDDLMRRVALGLDALPRDTRAVLVTHGAVFKGVLAHLLGLKTQYFLELRNGTCMRLDRRRIGTTDVVALTHFLHAAEDLTKIGS